jgi:DNA repair protein SbcD/Mre11
MRSVSPLQTKVSDCYRVLHTSDWHLGKMLNDQSREDEHARFLDWLLEAIGEHAVDALVVVGDLFDSANPPQTAQTQYFDFVSALFRQGGCAMVVVGGNHDSPGQLEAPNKVLRALGVHVLGFLPDAPQDRLVALPSQETPHLIVAAIPFLRDRDLRTGQSGQGVADIQRERIAGTVQRYAETAEVAAEWRGKGVPILATGHLMVMGTSSSESEREIHIGGLGAVEGNVFPELFSYVALGHMHRPQRTGGSEHIRYSGSPIPLSFSEANDKKEVRLLDFSDGSLCKQEPLPVPVFRKLSQIRTNRADLERELDEFPSEPNDLTTWVEVVVEDAGIGENLNEVVQEAVKDRDFEVLKVLRGGATSLQGMSAEELSDEEGIDTLLDDPSQVFQQRLDEEIGLEEEGRRELEMAFAQLLEIHDEEEAGT